ncbi:MAG TPA: response regulator transcription factor, partial [Anaerolineales bacterium]|nr:response regulator transcription factor [Anaerolineales bacterium]
RAGLRNLLNAEPDFEVVGEAADGIQALEMAEQTDPDLILVDINMPNMSGIEMLQQLRAKQDSTKVLMLTVHEDDGLLKKAIRAGASGYLVKRAAESDLINAIRTVMQGDMYVHPSMTRALLKDLVPASLSKSADDNTLTHREIEILRMVARGYTNNQIAQKLSISARTVEGHRANLMGKLGLHSRVELVEYAEQHGLME